MFCGYFGFRVPMDAAAKSGPLRSVLVKMLVFGIVVLLFRFFYVVTIWGEACKAADFCFFPDSANLLNSAVDSKAFVRATAASGGGASGDGAPASKGLRYLWTSKEWRRGVEYYSSVFQDLMAEGFLSPDSKALCIGTPAGQDVFTLREMGVTDAIGLYKKASPPLVVSSGKPPRRPFANSTFDFVFLGGGGVVDRLLPAAADDFATDVCGMMKPEGYLVVHTTSAKDLFSQNSLLDLFNCCRLVRAKDIAGGSDSSSPSLRELVMVKAGNGSPSNKCAAVAQEHRWQLVGEAEPLIKEEPLKPWITLKRNIQNIKYLPNMADISFKRRYIYIDVGARSYGSSISSWFRKQYPKQNRTFEVYAIEADKAFHEEYVSKKKKVTLIPYAAWVRNETLFFEINRDPGQSHDEKAGGRGMGRIRPVEVVGPVAQIDRIRGFDFGEWLKSTVSEKDFVVMKMDVEGTEFDLIPRLFETGTICLIDELFLECHYNRWQRCCPGERSSKYQKTYDQCLGLFTSLRDSGVLVHQWW